MLARGNVANFHAMLFANSSDRERERVGKMEAGGQGKGARCAGARTHRSIRKRNASQLFPPPLLAGSPVSFMDRSQWWFYAAIEDACLPPRLFSLSSLSLSPFLMPSLLFATFHSLCLFLAAALLVYRVPPLSLSISLCFSLFLDRPHVFLSLFLSPALLPLSVLLLVKYAER